MDRRTAKKLGVCAICVSQPGRYRTLGNPVLNLLGNYPEYIGGILICEACWRLLEPLVPSLREISKAKGRLKRILRYGK